MAGVEAVGAAEVDGSVDVAPAGAVEAGAGPGNEPAFCAIAPWQAMAPSKPMALNDRAMRVSRAGLPDRLAMRILSECVAENWSSRKRNRQVPGGLPSHHATTSAAIFWQMSCITVTRQASPVIKSHQANRVGTATTAWDRLRFQASWSRCASIRAATLSKRTS